MLDVQYGLPLAVQRAPVVLLALEHEHSAVFAVVPLVAVHAATHVPSALQWLPAVQSGPFAPPQLHVAPLTRSPDEHTGLTTLPAVVALLVVALTLFAAVFS